MEGKHHDYENDRTADESSSEPKKSADSLFAIYGIDRIKNEGFSAINDVIEKYWKIMNVRVESNAVAKNGEQVELEEIRKKLKTEPGVVISNHPGYFDVPAILETLHRTDVLAMVLDKYYQELADKLGEERVVAAASDPKKLLDGFKKIKKHIEAGGLFLIFPTGGHDYSDNKNREFIFRDGFDFLIKHVLRPEDMVYCFHVDPEDVRSIASERIPRALVGVTELVLPEALNLNTYKEQKVIHMQESYGQAREWQEVSAKSRNNKTDVNRALEEHYMRTFGVTREDL